MINKEDTTIITIQPEFFFSPQHGISMQNRTRYTIKDNRTNTTGRIINPNQDGA